MINDLEDLIAENDRLRAALDEIAKVHHAITVSKHSSLAFAEYHCEECDVEWPCRTAAILRRAKGR